jgi:hypothetical protein
MISFRRFTLFSEMSFLAVIIALFFFFKNLAPFLCLPLKALFSFSERRISFSLYFVEMPSRFALEMGIFVISLIFLGPFSKIVVETCDCRD